MLVDAAPKLDFAASFACSHESKQKSIASPAQPPPNPARRRRLLADSYSAADLDDHSSLSPSSLPSRSTSRGASLPPRVPVTGEPTSASGCARGEGPGVARCSTRPRREGPTREDQFVSGSPASIAQSGSEKNICSWFCCLV
ncbi:hypothetical protein C2845_PM08G15660 [Panicum miliaceum]|uniref:Uncharacterized protein n=1 Tax=Panicum miliaceum TaxID=4540 RepID=A0A3L6QXB2_PANMI|nr:hypothetical protein C2845_PM08G15660 [Panicum miliaceum]